jgi:DNA-binding GntR family transcriptional regulator
VDLAGRIALVTQSNSGALARQYRSGTEELTDRIREAIVSGELSSEETLTQVSLADRFQVSRTPLREVLRVLELEGLIDRERNGRFRIKPYSLDEVEEVCVIRMGLEATAVRLTVPTLTNADHAALEGLLAAIDRFAHVEDWKGIEDPHRDFHRRIAAGVGPRTTELREHLWNQAARYRRASFQKIALEGMETRRTEHRNLLDAVEEYDAERAAAWMAIQTARTAVEIAHDLEPSRRLDKVHTVLDVYVGDTGISLDLLKA